MADKLILLILIISVIKDRLIPKLKAPCPMIIANLLFANFIRIFWLYIYHLSSGMDSMSFTFIFISVVEFNNLSTS